ncbi:MAG TPA: MBL fold metallo-hydrolase [Holophaga sp.]|nr:MBL fold metallo-hydrolase [Holophaga sp.]HQL47054.1 MBL fold metallo-hydrolase [Holophaga sp.]
MRTLPLFLALALGAPLVAQAPAAPAAPAKIHKVEKLSDRAYAIFGQGGNIGLFVGDQEAVLVDTQFARLVPGLFEAIASVTDKPIRFLVNTHHHGDHVGGNALVASKVQAIIAHANVRRRMEAEQAKLDPAQRGGLPTLLLGEKDSAKPARLDLRLPGLEVHIVHRSAAHTDGDLILGLPGDRVMHLGDLMFLGMLPFIDAKDGAGSFKGLVDTVAWLASWIPEDVKIIPGHGPLCGRKEVLRYRDFLKALQAHAAARPGTSSADLAASFDAAAWPEWKPTATFVTWETLFDAVTERGPGRVVRP